MGAMNRAYISTRTLEETHLRPSSIGCVFFTHSKSSNSILASLIIDLRAFWKIGVVSRNDSSTTRSWLV